MPAIIREKIRSVPDFPKPGILFRDITPVLRDPAAFHRMVDLFVQRYAAQPPDAVVAVESRGYLIGAPLAYALGTGLVIVRKPGKLPHEVDCEPYALEYGSDSLEIHVDSLHPGERALVVDDLLATGGTAEATVKLVERRGARVMELAFIVELAALGGRARLGAERVFSLLTY